MPTDIPVFFCPFFSFSDPHAEIPKRISSFSKRVQIHTAQEAGTIVRKPGTAKININNMITYIGFILVCKSLDRNMTDDMNPSIIIIIFRLIFEKSPRGKPDHIEQFHVVNIGYL